MIFSFFYWTSTVFPRFFQYYVTICMILKLSTLVRRIFFAPLISRLYVHMKKLLLKIVVRIILKIVIRIIVIFWNIYIYTYLMTLVVKLILQYRNILILRGKTFANTIRQKSKEYSVLLLSRLILLPFKNSQRIKHIKTNLVLQLISDYKL